MGAFLDGLQVLQSHYREVVMIAALILWGGALSLWLLRGCSPDDAGASDQISLAAALWVLPTTLFSAVALLIQRWIRLDLGSPWPFALASLLAFPLLWARIRRWYSTDFKVLLGASALLGLTLILAVLRLGSIWGMVLPPYFDSATHYGLIQQLLQWTHWSSNGNFALPSGQYYHLGYHVLQAGLASATNVDVGKLMLVSAQLALAVTPVALYALALRMSGSNSGALIAVLLAAFGWYMPAFAANWGKFPALFSLLPAIGAITVAFMAVKSANSSVARRRLWTLCLLLAVVAGLVHSRALLVILMAGAAAMVSYLIWKLPDLARRVLLICSLLAVMLLLWRTARVPEFLPALEPYAGSGLWPTLLASILGVLALRQRPQMALGICLFVILLLAGLVVPVPFVGMGGALDRPFVELWLFAPLSILGALGFSGLVPTLGAPRTALALLVVALFLGAHSLAAYDLDASACCVEVAPDDMVALNWLSRNATPYEKVGIATELLALGPESTPTLEAPVDAGAWIKPLTGIGVVPLAANLDLGQPAALDELCRRGVSYLYLGGSRRGFDPLLAATQPTRLATRLELPGATVLEVLGCQI